LKKIDYKFHGMTSLPKPPSNIMLPEFVFADTTEILITPVSKTLKPKKSKKPDSLRDYREQCERFSQGQPMCWDDAPQNKTKIGHIFGFCKNGKEVDIHRVEAVHDTSHRLPSWSNNVGQHGRNVLMLSCPLCVIPWSDWVTFDWNTNCVQGTQRVAKPQSRVQMIGYINALLRSGTEV
jgi:hypothetical protein